MSCAPLINCPPIDDALLYSLEDLPLPFTLVCPVSDCSQSDAITVNCCSSMLSASLAGMTPQQRQTTISNLVEQCLQQNLFCNGNGGDPTHPTTLFFNNPQQCSFPCPDGTQFNYTIPSGRFLAGNQASADAQARNLACSKAKELAICFGDLPDCLCLGAVFLATLTTTTQARPFTWQLLGNLPPGLNLNTTPTTITINGIPNVAGTYTFSVLATDNDGNSSQKNFTMNVIQILPTSMPLITIGVPISVQLSLSGCSVPPLSWQVTQGALPTGLTLNEQTGVISGTPTGGFSGFTITVQTMAT